MASLVVVVLSWNNVKDTLECLDSLQRVDYSDFCIVLVDNGSIDGTVAIVRERFPDVHIIENGRNLGYAEGNNVGIRFALHQEADYIFILNNDTVVDANAVSQLIAVAEGNYSIGMLCPSIISYFDRSKQYIGARINWENGTAGEIEQSSEVCETEYAPGCALLIRSEVVQQIGLLDPTYFMYFEDVDWSLRCKKASYQVVVVPQARIYHKGTNDQIACKSPTVWFYFRRNQCLFMRRYIGWRVWSLFLKRYTLACLLQLQSAIQEGDLEKANAVMDGWWAGITGRYGADRTKMPIWIKLLVRRRLNLLLWLTSPVQNLRKHFPVRSTVRRIWHTWRRLF